MSMHRESSISTLRSSPRGHDRRHEREIVEMVPPSSPQLFEALRRGGVEELERPTSALLSSGFVAGLVMFMSVAMKAMLGLAAGEHPMREALAALGYCSGFVMVIFGRLQLFTEATITAVIPLIDDPCRATVLRTARLWALVLTANLLGTLAASAMAYYGGLATSTQLSAMLEVSQVVLSHRGLSALALGIPAGFVIAALVWCMPNAGHSRLGLIVMATYFIALGDFAHVVAGSAEVWLLVFDGQLALGPALWAIVLPSCLGNIIGGTVLFTSLTYAQVHREVSPGPP